MEILRAFSCTSTGTLKKHFFKSNYNQKRPKKVHMFQYHT